MTLVDQARAMAARAVDAGPGELSWMIERLSVCVEDMEQTMRWKTRVDLRARLAAAERVVEAARAHVKQWHPSPHVGLENLLADFDRTEKAYSSKESVSGDNWYDPGSGEEVRRPTDLNSAKQEGE